LFDVSPFSLLFGRNFKSKGRSKSTVHSTRRCWKCGKARHYKKDCKSKTTKVSIGSDEKQSIERKTTSDKGGDVYLASTSTQSDQDVWLINSGEPYQALGAMVMSDTWDEISTDREGVIAMK
jgi:hypothetical protein